MLYTEKQSSIQISIHACTDIFTNISIFEGEKNVLCTLHLEDGMLGLIRTGKKVGQK